MTISADIYQSYLLRFRRNTNQDPWRITIRSVETEEQYHFAQMEDMVKFLETQLDVEISLSG